MGKFAFLEEEEEEDTRAVASRLINSAPPTNMLKSTGLVRKKLKLQCVQFYSFH